MDTITPIDPSSATQDDMRTWISTTSRSLATLLHGSPTITALRAVMQSIGYPDLRSAIADDRECVTKLADYLEAIALFRMLRDDLRHNPNRASYPPAVEVDRSAQWRRKMMGLPARPRGESLETSF